VAALATFVYCPGWFFWLSDRIGHQAELLKYLGLLPTGLMVYDSTIVKSILLPEADKSTILQSWQLYGNLKCGTVVALLYGIAFVVAGMAALLFNWQRPAPSQSALLITSIVGALTVSGTLYFAQIRIEELFREHRSQKP
jgi:Na+-transporting NADH:ubiquinone oxidoreductase subunit NqrB